jgi:hypothetical protein
MNKPLKTHASMPNLRERFQDIVLRAIGEEKGVLGTLCLPLLKNGGFCGAEHLGFEVKILFAQMLSLIRGFKFVRWIKHDLG